MDNGLPFFGSQSRYVLDINNSTVSPEVLRFRGREALSTPFSWKIEFTTAQANIAPEQVLMKYATLRMRNGKVVHGILTRLEWLSTSADQSHYRVTLESRLALLSRRRNCAIFQNQSVPDVVEQVLRDHGLEGPDFEYRLERTYPPRELITQWRETDLQFIQRLLSEVGIHFSAPQGVAFTSGEDMQLAASKNVAINVGGDISAGAMGNMTVLTGEKLGLFVRSGQLSLKSGEGPVEMQAQNGNARLFAEQKLTLTSADDILFAGKKRITLNGGGSYLKIEPGKIEYGTTSQYLRKVKRTAMTATATMPLNLPVMPLADLFAPEAAARNLKPVIRLSDAPGINGLAQSARPWQIVEANSYTQAITTDDVLMNGQTDNAGNVLGSEAQQEQLATLASQYASRLTEQIYVHSKLMIVDDRYVLVGSANINDRSLMGDRDSELAVLISDTAHSYHDLDGSGVAAPTRNFARELRQNAWRKWLGSAAGECAEALDKPTLKVGWGKIQALAKKNAENYEAVFNYIPRDDYKTESSGNDDIANSKGRESASRKANVMASIWSVIEANSTASLSDSQKMPFSETFWRNYKHEGNDTLQQVKGYFTALPVRWTEGENNLVPYNIRLIARNAMPDDGEQQLTDNNGRSRSRGELS